MKPINSLNPRTKKIKQFDLSFNFDLGTSKNMTKIIKIELI